MKSFKPSLNVTWCWTNWTFGVWYGRYSKTRWAWGIDLGPFEVVYRHNMPVYRHKA